MNAIWFVAAAFVIAIVVVPRLIRHFHPTSADDPILQSYVNSLLLGAAVIALGVIGLATSRWFAGIVGIATGVGFLVLALKARRMRDNSRNQTNGSR